MTLTFRLVSKKNFIYHTLVVPLQSKFSAIYEAVNKGHIKTNIPVYVYGEVSSGNQMSTVTNFLPELAKTPKLSPAVKTNTNFKSKYDKVPATL